MTESVQISEFRLCVLSAFEGVSLDNVSWVTWEPDTVLEEFRLNHKSWTDLPFAYFDALGPDSIWLSDGRKLVYLLPSIMMHTIDRWGPRKFVPFIASTFVSRLVEMAKAGYGTTDFHTRRLLTIFQSHTVFLYLRFVAANDDDDDADKASEAIDLFWGRFQDC